MKFAIRDSRFRQPKKVDSRKAMIFFLRHGGETRSGYHPESAASKASSKMWELMWGDGGFEERSESKPAAPPKTPTFCY